MNVIGKLLPVDGYVVKSKRALPANFLQSLTHLYQPLIGPVASMLYQTLMNEVTMQGDGQVQSHHTLMNYMMLPLDRIYDARVKLEALGLLKTYKKDHEGATIYTYELQPPYDPKQFFEDAMYAPLLFHYIGEQKFNRLKAMFTEEVQEKGKEITADFDDVFRTTPVERLPQVNAEPEEIWEKDGTLDFSWVEHLLKQRMIPVHRVLTKENRRLISDMLVLYELESFEIEKALIYSINEENYLNQEEFKRSCHDIFSAKNDHQPIRLIPKNEPVKTESLTDEPLTREEQLIRVLETISPKQLLEDLSSGKTAAEQDMKLISDVMTKQGLSAPVMNVLIHYVLLQTNMKLSRGYLEKIAGQWSRAKLKTARQAIAFAKKEREKYEEAKARRTSGGYSKGNVKDIVPEWYKQGKHNEKPKEADGQVMSEEQRKVAELLKQYAEGK